MIQCRVKEEVKVRKQETVEEGIQCFRCWGVGHYKWEYSNIKVEKERRRSEEVVHVVNLQKAQQEERLVRSLWRKVQEYYGKRGIPPRGTALEDKMEGNNICRVWEVQVTKAPKHKRTRDRGLSLENS